MARMNNSTSNSPEPLPDSFESDLLRLDARLTQEARHCDLPPGLAGRVFEASVGQLPSSGYQFEIIPTSTRARKTASRRQNWSRVAIAASLLMAFTLSARMLLNQSPPALVDPIAQGTEELIQPTLLNTQLASNQTELALTHDTVYLLSNFASNGDEDISFLSLPVISFDGLHNELANIITSLNEGEM